MTTPDDASGSHVLIVHEVASYAAWKAHFDAAEGLRRAAGERAYQLLRFVDDPNRIVHFSVWSSVDDARRFFESDEVEAIRRAAGVTAPTFQYLEALERRTL